MSNMEKNNFFANPDKSGHVMRSIVAFGIVCMLLFAVVSCDASKEQNGYDNVEKCECDFDDDFDLSALYFEHCISRWAVELTLKYGTTDCPLEDPKIKALVAEHNVTFRMSFPGTSDTVLTQFFTLIGEDCSNLCYVRAIIRAFLMTGLFENHIRVFGSYTTG